MVEYACEDISGVSSSQVEMNADLQFYDNISTDEIQKILIKSASDLISLFTFKKLSNCDGIIPHVCIFLS